MRSSITTTSEQIELLHHLPMTSLEKQLKRCKNLNPSYHSRVLSPEEMVQYITWMSDNFGGREDFQFATDDFFMLTGGNVAKAGFDMMRHAEKARAQQQLADIFRQPSESQFFSEQQSVSASRFLRHLPAYWQRGDYFDLYYVYSGSFPVWVEDEQITLSPGDLLLIPPGVRKACKCPDDDCVAFLYMIRSSTFSKVFWEQLSDENLMSLFFRQALGRQYSTAYLRFATGCNQGIEALLHTIFLQYTSNSTYSAQMVNSLMSTFFLYLLQNFEQTASVSKKSSFYWKPEFSSILSYIQTHYQTVTLEELSRIFSYSQRQIIRIIRSCTSKTFTQLVTQLRMEKAAVLLHTDIPIETIALEIGYTSLSGFYQAFLNHFHTTPGQWRQSADN